MKPKNFPERKRQRQIGALERMKPEADYYGSEHEKTVLQKAAAAGTQRTVRSKKRK